MTMNIPTDLLRTFVTIADIGSFSRAGEALGRSQPAITLQIQRLETMIGASLLQRRGRRMHPTEEGEMLLDYARQILRLNDQAINSLMRPRVAGHVHLGIPNEFAISVLPRILARFSQAYPDITLEVTCGLSTNLLMQLDNQMLDLVIAVHDEPVVDAQRAWTENIVWVSSPGHDSLNDSPVPLIVAPQGCVYRKRIISSLSQRQRPWQIVYTSASYGGIRAAALAGLGVTALAYSTIPEGLRVLPDDGTFQSLAPADVGLHFNSAKADDAVGSLADFITGNIQPQGLGNAIGGGLTDSLSA